MALSLSDTCHSINYPSFNRLIGGHVHILVVHVHGLYIREHQELGYFFSKNP